MPPGWGFSSFYRPGGGGFELFFARGLGVLNSFFARGVGNSPIKKLPGGFARGDGQAWN